MDKSNEFQTFEESICQSRHEAATGDCSFCHQFREEDYWRGIGRSIGPVQVKNIRRYIQMNKKAALALAFLFLALFLGSIMPTGLAQSEYTIKIANNPDLGNYLVDGQGRTLYRFTKDAPETSNCNGQCAVIWPSFYTEGINVPSELNAADFGMITREDGMKQTTYKGSPLYYFSRDMAAGDVNGQKLNGVWFVVNVNSSY
jgi:predicted lipoprotein with Yx(FWY)xxD motif